MHRSHYARVQIIWQDPVVFLNPFLPVLTLIVEPMAAFGLYSATDRKKRALWLMRMTGVSRSLSDSTPDRLSGGQCQRVAIARALSVFPHLLICDEALVSLDLPQQVRILELLTQLQHEMDLAILFISHDMATVKTICKRMVILDG